MVRNDKHEMRGDTLQIFWKNSGEPGGWGASNLLSSQSIAGCIGPISPVNLYHTLMLPSNPPPRQ